MKNSFSICREALQDMRDMETHEGRDSDFLNGRPTADDAFRNLEAIEARMAELEAELERYRDALGAICDSDEVSGYSDTFRIAHEALNKH